MLPARGSPRSMYRLTSVPSASTATRVSNGSLLAMISLPMPSLLEQNLLPTYPDVDEQPGGGEHDDERAPAVADERQGDAGDRHQPDRHADVHEQVERDHRDDAHRHEHPQTILGLRGDGPGAPEPQGEEGEHEDRPSEPQLLAHHGEDEVGVLLGDEV